MQHSEKSYTRFFFNFYKLRKGLTFSKIGLMDESRKDMTFLQIEVVKRTKDVGWDNGGEYFTGLFCIGTGRKRERENVDLT